LYYIYIISIYFFDSKTPCDRKDKRIPRSIFYFKLPPSKPKHFLWSSISGKSIYLNSSINKFHPQHFSSKAVNNNLNQNLPALINSKEVINNYEKDRLSVDLLNSKYFFSPWFIVGFVEAEGNFDILLNKNPNILPKFRFRLTSKYLDIVLLCAIKNFFGSGSLYLRKETQVFTLEISNQEVIENKIIPLFDSHPLKGTKYYDYINWRDGFKDFLSNKDLNSRISLIERIKERKLELNNSKLEFKLPIEHLNNFDGHYISGLYQVMVPFLL